MRQRERGWIPARSQQRLAVAAPQHAGQRSPQKYAEQEVARHPGADPCSITRRTIVGRIHDTDARASCRERLDDMLEGVHRQRLQQDVGNSTVSARTAPPRASASAAARTRRIGAGAKQAAQSELIELRASGNGNGNGNGITGIMQGQIVHALSQRARVRSALIWVKTVAAGKVHADDMQMRIKVERRRALRNTRARTKIQPYG